MDIWYILWTFGIFCLKFGIFSGKFGIFCGTFGNDNFFAENCQKSQKLVIITSTPGHPELILKIRLKCSAGSAPTIKLEKIGMKNQVKTSYSNTLNSMGDRGFCLFTFFDAWRQRCHLVFRKNIIFNF
jgi:hypothetical protein